MAYIIKVDNKEFKADIKKEGDNFKILLNGKEFKTEIIPDKNRSQFSLIIDQKPYIVFIDSDNQISVNGEIYATEVIDEQIQKLIKAGPSAVHKKELTITAPMPGLVIEIEVKEGDIVKQGQGLVIVEAMKMQNEMKAPRDGVVKKILVQKGQTVNSKDKLVIIE